MSGAVHYEYKIKLGPYLTVTLSYEGRTEEEAQIFFERALERLSGTNLKDFSEVGADVSHGVLKKLTRHYIYEG